MNDFVDHFAYVMADWSSLDVIFYRRGSRLQYRRASKKAEGEYKCVAENVIRRVEKTVDIEGIYLMRCAMNALNIELYNRSNKKMFI